MLKVLDVDGAVRRTRGGWLATGEPWTYDTARLRRVAEARTAEQKTMIEYADTTTCRMEFLRRCLDDPEAKPCGRCDTCAEPLFDAEVSAGVAVRRARVPRPPRRRDRPEEDVADRHGRRSACRSRARSRRPSRSPPGRAVGPAVRPGLGQPPARPGRARRPPDGPIPDDLAGAVVEVLKAWAHGDDGWAAAPGGGGGGRVPPPARSWCTVAGRAHRHGRPAAAARHADVGPRRRRGPRGNSAQRVRALHDAFTVPPDAGRGAGRRWTARSCWWTTWSTRAGRWSLAGRALRRAGAPRRPAAGAGGGGLT